MLPGVYWQVQVAMAVAETHLEGCLQEADDLRHAVKLRVGMLCGGGLLLRCACYDIGQRARQALDEIWAHLLFGLLHGSELLLQCAFRCGNIPAGSVPACQASWEFQCKILRLGYSEKAVRKKSLQQARCRQNAHMPSRHAGCTHWGNAKERESHPRSSIMRRATARLRSTSRSVLFCGFTSASSPASSAGATWRQHGRSTQYPYLLGHV